MSNASKIIRIKAETLRALVGIFPVCVLIFSDLYWNASVAEGQAGRDHDSPPMRVETLNDVLLYRIKSGYRGYYTTYCGHYSYDDAWIAYVPGGQLVCMIYRVKDNSFSMVRGDHLVPIASDIIMLLLEVGNQQMIFFNCDSDVFRCQDPVIMPPAESLDLDSRENLTIGTLATESENAEPEELFLLRTRTSKRAI